MGASLAWMGLGVALGIAVTIGAGKWWFRRMIRKQIQKIANEVLIRRGIITDPSGPTS